MLFKTDWKAAPLTDHIAVIVVEPDLVFQVKFFGSEALLQLVELPIRQGVLHGDGNLSGDLHQEIDIFVRPNVGGGSGDFEGSQRAIASDERNRAGGLAAHLHESAESRRGVAVHIGIAHEHGFAGCERLVGGHSLRRNVRPLLCQKTGSQ